MDGKYVIDAIKRMRPAVYQYNVEWLDDNREHFGFIAQELEVLFSKDDYGVVVEDSKGNLQVRYHEIIPMLVKYIHHLEERVSELERKNVEE